VSNDIQQTQGNKVDVIRIKTDNPNLKEWMKENPGKTINDYYANLKGDK